MHIGCRPTEVKTLAGKGIKTVVAGSDVSYAIGTDGAGYAWGFGENLQLTNGSEEVSVPPSVDDDSACFTAGY